MSDGMERIMREIHVMFAKAEKVPSREDMIIVDKKRVFALLEALNHEVYDAMDRYEESKTSRELAIQRRTAWWKRHLRAQKRSMPDQSCIPTVP